MPWNSIFPNIKQLLRHQHHMVNVLYQMQIAHMLWSLATSSFFIIYRNSHNVLVLRASRGVFSLSCLPRIVLGPQIRHQGIQAPGLWHKSSPCVDLSCDWNASRPSHASEDKPPDSGSGRRLIHLIFREDISLHNGLIRLAMALGGHSDLEVVPQAERADAQKYPYYSPEPIPIYPNAPTDTHKETWQGGVQEQDRPRKICGLKKRTFWIVLIVAIVVVAAAVGGGVGGALASRSSNSSSNTAQAGSQSSSGSASSSSTPTPTSTTASVTTTELVGPTSTILRDCPSSNDTIYSVVTGTSTMQFRKACEISFLNANGIDNSVGGVTSTLDECINRCAAYNISNRTRIEQGTDRICNSVCWRNTFDDRNDWAGGQCFGFTTLNTTSNGQSAWRFRTPIETRCDSAALMNQDY